MDKGTERAINVMIISLIAILLLLVFGIYNNEREIEYEWEGPGGVFNFVIDDSTGKEFHLAKLEYGLGSIDNVPFNYGPEFLQDIEFDKNINFNLLDKERVYIVQNPEDSTITEGKTLIASLTMWRIFLKPFDPVLEIDAQIAITNTYGGDNGEFPIVNCEDASNSIGVILLQAGESNRGYVDNGCVILEFEDGEGSVMMATDLVYHILGIL
jgi:hypothetical protein